MSLPVPTLIYPTQIRKPESVPARDVCPTCKRATVTHTFLTGTFRNISHHCPEHGAVVPVRSAVVNGY